MYNETEIKISKFALAIASLLSVSMLSVVVNINVDLLFLYYEYLKANVAMWNGTDYHSAVQFINAAKNMAA